MAYTAEAFQNEFLALGVTEVNAIVSLVGRADDVVVTTQVIDIASGESRVGYTGNHNETLVRDEGIR